MEEDTLELLRYKGDADALPGTTVLAPPQSLVPSLVPSLVHTISASWKWQWLQQVRVKSYTPDGVNEGAQHINTIDRTSRCSVCVWMWMWRWLCAVCVDVDVWVVGGRGGENHRRVAMVYSRSCRRRSDGYASRPLQRLRMESTQHTRPSTE